MPSRDPAKPGGTEKDATEPAAAKEALTLAQAEAKAAEAEAAAARARAELLKLQRDSEPEDATDSEPDSDEPKADKVGPQAGTAERVEQPRLLSRIRSRLHWVAATLAVLAIGGLIAADVLMLLHHRGATQRQHQAAEYAAAARQGVVTLMSLNYETVDEDVKRIIDNSTGEFKKDFEAHAGDFTKTARESKTVTEATATVSGVESMSDNEAVVLVAASTKVTNTAGAKEEPRNWRLTVHVARDGDQVKMSKVDFAT
ncbi:hypothetical protein [Mycolicibacter longobardus]|uniref:Uncharacterized protein n=1 Tax=Mycolicibacter longobardus TaxID=1108812 RepID=A0A1X1YSH3_9MYCO|nr:hypothetical protein [Mycolicibacter longobardus]MCV7383276.1 hypothetical protein [Mycolicibacter longobardus]ORW13921.1 hypothetical protein AWC16_03950 [Mycolicibacter longobardus]